MGASVINTQLFLLVLVSGSCLAEYWFGVKTGSSSSGIGGCPVEFEYHENSCYRFSQHGDERTWAQAMAECQRLGGYLAEVTSVSENNFLTAKITLAHGSLWIGGTDADAEGTWVWEPSGNLIDSGYTNWGPNQPDNYRDMENCLVYRPSNRKWNDYDCDFPNRYICEHATGTFDDVMYECMPDGTIVIQNTNIEGFQTSFANDSHGICTSTYNADFSKLTITGCSMDQDILLVFTNRTEDHDDIVGGHGVDAYILHCSQIGTGYTRGFTLGFSPTLSVAPVTSITPHLDIVSAFREEFTFGSAAVSSAVLTSLLYWTIDVPMPYYSKPLKCTVYSGTSVSTSALNKVLIQDGCSQDSDLVGNFGNFLNNGNYRRNWASIHVFKFYDSDYITIQCTIEFCLAEADCTPTCTGRRRRSAPSGDLSTKLAETTLRILEKNPIVSSGSSNLVSGTVVALALLALIV